MTHYSKPPLKLKLINSFHKHILNIYLFLFLCILLLCNNTSNNDIPSNIHALTYLIYPPTGDIGQRCCDIGSNCNFFPGWGDKNSMGRHELNNVCILRCPTLDSCHDTDMHLSVNMALIMNVKIFDDAVLIYIAANGINSITNSEIYCPLLNGNNYAKTCVIESSCMAIDNFIPIDGHINEIAMTEHVSICSGNGYLNLDLGCDFEYENMCTKLLKYSILLRDNSLYDVQDICWIDYDMFICDLQLQCTNYYSNENMIPAARPQLNDAFTINTHFMETLISSHLEAENTLTRNTITNSLFMVIIVITMKGNISIYWNDD